MIVEAIAAHTRAASVPGVRLIAIDGESGAGKSTLASKLALELDAPLIQIDDFVSWDNFSGWWPRFETQVLGPLLAGRDAVHQQRDWAGDEFGDTLGEWRTVSWAPVVVLEGITASRKSVTDRLACRVWVDAPPHVRLHRGIARDGEDHRALWEKWMVEEAAFFEADDTRARADFVVSGTAQII